ncbi:MAG: hypothetical protein KatS3mg021_1321 [Fimbriimonadales bacterium]|nr:MAG: hypothetical protein KatS3mg021_1321 [Fimbriimonadales bacterium]
MGLSRWQTLWRIALPYALPGILTGIILSLGRAVGEATPVLFTASIYYTTAETTLGWETLRQPVANLPYYPRRGLPPARRCARATHLGRMPDFDSADASAERRSDSDSFPNAEAIPMIAAMTLPKQKVAMETVELSVSYNGKPALKSVSLAFPANAVTALIGPSGCGKSTLLRCLNRMNDRIPGAEITGKVMLNGEDIYARRVNLTRLRREVGMVFQKPNPFPMSIFENVALGPRLHYGLRGRALQEVVEDALRKAALWDEVKDELHKSGLALSGGATAAALHRPHAGSAAPNPADGRASAAPLDPISTQKIEELIVELGKQYTVIVGDAQSSAGGANQPLHGLSHVRRTRRVG